MNIGVLHVRSADSVSCAIVLANLLLIWDSCLTVTNVLRKEGKFVQLRSCSKSQNCLHSRPHAAGIELPYLHMSMEMIA